MEGVDPVVAHCRYTGRVRCPHCRRSEHHRLKDSFIRRVRHESIGRRSCVLSFQSHKYRCGGCGRYFRPRYPGILPYQRATERFRAEVAERHEHGTCLSRLRDTYHLSWSTIERWVWHTLSRRVAETSSAPSPRILGIDEHFFTRRRGFATTFANLRTHKVFDVVLGRSEADLAGFLGKLKDPWRTRIVLMDLSETYRSIVKKTFVNALIVADRFHVIRLINQHFLEAWKTIDAVGRKSRGLLSLMRRHQENLKPEQVPRLRDYLKQHPVLERIYDFKQDLCRLLLKKKQTRQRCKTLVYDLLLAIEHLKDFPSPALRTLGETLDRWKDEIARMWRVTKTNGITGPTARRRPRRGLHNKMETLSRRAYGFRNFNNYRLRVKALCG